MHQAGLTGLPRRIPNFPDCYLELVNVSNTGMIMVIFSLILLTVLMSSVASSQVATTMLDTSHYPLMVSPIGTNTKWCSKYSSYPDSLIVPMFLH